MKKPNDYVEVGVPYENRTLYSINYCNSGLTIQEHLVKFMQLLDTTLCPQKQPRATAGISGQGMGAKRVRKRRTKPG